ncbi:MAG: hypothetical protein Q3972_05090 [Corynebacterium sp.]|nr:hypothetical protein [Corynebacterium sp.]
MRVAHLYSSRIRGLLAVLSALALVFGGASPSAQALTVSVSGDKEDGQCTFSASKSDEARVRRVSERATEVVWDFIEKNLGVLSIELGKANKAAWIRQAGDIAVAEFSMRMGKVSYKDLRHGVAEALLKEGIGEGYFAQRLASMRAAKGASAVSMQHGLKALEEAPARLQRNEDAVMYAFDVLRQAMLGNDTELKGDQVFVIASRMSQETVDSIVDLLAMNYDLWGAQLDGCRSHLGAEAPVVLQTVDQHLNALGYEPGTFFTIGEEKTPFGSSFIGSSL